MARRLHSQGYDSHLFPAQWAALRYVYLAPPERRTAIDLARFQGLASGPVARTVRTLVIKGYLVKRGTIGRGRAELLDLTERGLALLQRDPLRKVAEALASLESEERQILARSLRKAIKATMSGELPTLA